MGQNYGNCGDSNRICQRLVARPTSGLADRRFYFLPEPGRGRNYGGITVTVTDFPPLYALSVEQQVFARFVLPAPQPTPLRPMASRSSQPCAVRASPVDLRITVTVH